MNKHLIVIGIIVLLLAIGLSGCEELEKLDKPNYINVTVVCSVRVRAREPLPEGASEKYDKFELPLALVNVEIIKDGGERSSDILSAEGGKRQLTRTFKLYKEQSIVCIGNLVLESVPEEYSNYIFNSGSHTTPWSYIYPFTDYGGSFTQKVELTIEGWHPDLYPP